MYRVSHDTMKIFNTHGSLGGDYESQGGEED